MSRKIASALQAGVLAAFVTMPAQADDEAEAGWWYGGSITATSDYVYRGVSQTDEGPAVQVSVDMGHSSGLYAGAWGSNVDFDAPDGIGTEVNLYAGWVFEIANEAELDLYFIRYLYPGAKPGNGINYNELAAALNLFEYHTVTVAWSDSYLNTDESAFYYHFGVEFPLPVAELNLKVGFGYNDISNAAGSDYRDFQAGINRSWGAFNADLSYFDTSGYDAEVEDFLGPGKWADGRIVLTLSMEF